MKMFVQYMLYVVIIIAASYFVIPRIYGVNYPKVVGPKFDPAIRTVYKQEIDKIRPQVVLIGDSLSSTNIDPVLLSEDIHKDVYDISNPGSASTFWYLIIKNNIVTAKYKPEYLIILYRDSILTTPDYRVQGSYFQQIDEFAGSDDELLNRLAFVNKMNWLEKFADQYLPLYGSRQEIRATFDGGLRDIMPTLILRCNSDCVNGALSSVFRQDKFLSKVMGDAINSADDYLYTDANLDFSRQVNQSFLPDIIRLCRENGIQLILVRSGEFRFNTQDPAPKALEDYMAKLSDYATKNDVIFLDFFNDPRLTRDLFVDPLHLNAQGQAVFTHILAKALMPYIR